MDDEAKKEALKRLISDSSNINFMGFPNKALIPTKSSEYKQIFENMGMSGAPISSFPAVSALFSPKNSTYQGGGFSERVMGIPSPTKGTPDLMRTGGPMDVSPSGVAGELASNAIDPRNYGGIPKSIGAGVKKLAPELEEITSKELLSPDEIKARANANGVEQNIDNEVNNMFRQGMDVQGPKITPEQLDQIRSEIPDINSRIQNRPPMTSGVPDDNTTIFGKIKQLFNK